MRLAHAGMVALPLAGHADAGGGAGVAGGRKLKLGLIGCGGRGSWISGLFEAHGGFVFTAVGDYFAERASEVGHRLGVAEERCFSGLDGYKRVMEAGVDAVVLQTPPCFFPEHAKLAVESGLHIYMAKPVAVDVAGTREVGRLAEVATGKGLVFHSDYQLPRDPVNMEVFKRIRTGALGRLQAIYSSGWTGGNGYQDPPRSEKREDRLKDLIWCNDIELGGDYLVHYDIHILDAVVWVMGKVPVSAMGVAAPFRPSVHGDALDSTMVIYQFEDGTPWCHQGVLGAYHDWIKSGRLTASFQGTQAAGCLSYAGKAFVRGGPRHFSGGVPNPEASVRSNISDFYDAIDSKDVSNSVISRVVQSNYAAILGREAAAQRRVLTLAELLES